MEDSIVSAVDGVMNIDGGDYRESDGSVSRLGWMRRGATWWVVMVGIGLVIGQCGQPCYCAGLAAVGQIAGFH